MFHRYRRSVFIVLTVLIILAISATSSFSDDDILDYLPLILSSVGSHGGGDNSDDVSILPDTGITKCSDNESEIICPSVGEPFYGQDAQYGSNSLSYTDNGDGTVTDNVTELMWMQADDGQLRSWDDAVAYCDGLALAGHSDWRLPNQHELFELVDKARHTPAIDPVFSCQTSFYWSSSPDALSLNGAWALYPNLVFEGLK